MTVIVLNHNYEAAYKKKKSGKLLWVSCKADSNNEAAKLMDAYIAEQSPNEGWRRYAGPLKTKPTTNN